MLPLLWRNSRKTGAPRRFSSVEFLALYGGAGYAPFALVIAAFWTLVPGLLTAEEALLASNSKIAPSIAIFMDFDSNPDGAPMEIMKREADALLKPSGIRLDWRLASDNDGKKTFTGLMVLKFKGACRVEAGPPPEVDSAELGEIFSLGSTAVVNGRVLPFSVVECDRLRKALALMSPSASRLQRQNALGVALGRIVAHELYHVLARTTEHASEGLAKACHSVRDLADPVAMTFENKDTGSIRSAVR